MEQGHPQGVNKSVELGSAPDPHPSVFLGISFEFYEHRNRSRDAKINLAIFGKIWKKE